jgi:hypothetical protein
VDLRDDTANFRVDIDVCAVRYFQGIGRGTTDANVPFFEDMKDSFRSWNRPYPGVP